MSARRFVAFDLETATVVQGVGSFEMRTREIMKRGLPPDQTVAAIEALLEEFKTRLSHAEGYVDPLQASRPLGIACASFAFRSNGPLGTMTVRASGDRMDRFELEHVAEALLAYANEGLTICGWNTLGFDFDILCEELALVGEQDLARRVARLALSYAHVDALFDYFCRKAIFLKCETACLGMGVQGKPDDLDGGDAPALWTRNEPGDRDRVVAYCENDARMELELIESVEDTGELRWVAKTGRPQSLRIGRWQDVADAMRSPLPDTSWMKNEPPAPRSKFYGWAESYLSGEPAP